MTKFQKSRELYIMWLALVSKVYLTIFFHIKRNGYVTIFSQQNLGDRLLQILI